MRRYIGILALIFILAVIATAIYKLCGKRKKDEMKEIHVFVFYTIILYGAMSFVKMVLGDSNRVLFDSFYDIETMTYIHYGMPLLVFVIIVPFLHKKLFKEEFSNRFVRMFNSLFAFAVMAEFVLVGTINNKHYVISAAVCAVASLFVSILYKGKIDYCGRSVIKKRCFFILPIILLWTVTAIVYEPNQLILNNLEEFQIPYFSFLGLTLSSALLITLIYALISIFVLSNRQLSLFGALLFGISFAGYIQGNFMNGEMCVMDGNVQIWSGQIKLLNGVIWIVIISFSIFCNIHLKYDKVKKACQMISIYLCLTQTASMVYMIISTDYPAKEDTFLITTNHALEISSKNNVIVFVLDWFDQQIMDEILRKNPEFDKELADFTCYHNSASRYAFTAQAIPYLLTNVEWENGMSDEQYIKYAFENGKLLCDISKQKYSIGVYTDTEYVTTPATELMVNYSDDIKIKLGFAQTIYITTKTSKYKMAPFALKKEFNYTTSDINDIIDNSGIWTANNDIVFHEMIAKNGLSFTKNDDFDGAFRFYHLKGAHPLFTMDDEFRKTTGNRGNQISQSRGALKIVYEYMQNMKKLGVYDDATIIITADHGQNTHVGEPSSDPYDCDLTSSPILYVKLPNEHNDKVKYSNAPVSHTEFAATIINAVGASPEPYGKMFNQIAEEENRERIFTYIEKKYQKWQISGDVNDMMFWKLIEE